MQRSSNHGTIPDVWQRVPLVDVAEVAFSGVDKRTVEGELPVQLCNYTDVCYNRRIVLGMDLMTATATPSEKEKWALRKGGGKLMSSLPRIRKPPTRSGFPASLLTTCRESCAAIIWGWPGHERMLWMARSWRKS